MTVSQSKSSWKVSTTKSVPADQYQSAKSARGSSWIDPSTLRPLTLFPVCFLPFPISRHCPLSTIYYGWNRLVDSGPNSFLLMPMQGIYRCPFRRIWHFKSSYSRCNYSYLSTPKTPHFFYLPFCWRGKFLAICFWWWCFIVDRNELKYFLKRSLQSTFISVIIIHRNVHVYFYTCTTCTHLYFNILIITWKRKLARKKSVLIS